MQTKKFTFAFLFFLIYYSVLLFTLMSCGSSAEEKYSEEKKLEKIELCKPGGPDYPIIIKEISGGGLQYSIYQFGKHQYIRFGRFNYVWGGHYPDCPCGKGAQSQSIILSNQIDSIRFNGDNQSLHTMPSGIDSLKQIEKRNQWLKDSLEAAKHHYYGC